MKLEYNKNEIPILANYVIQRFEKKQKSLESNINKLKSFAHDPDCKEILLNPNHKNQCFDKYDLEKSIAWKVAILGDGFIENLTTLKDIIQSDDYKMMLTLIDNIRVLDYTICWFRSIFPVNKYHSISDYISSLSRDITWIILGIPCYICGYEGSFEKLIFNKEATNE